MNYDSRMFLGQADAAAYLSEALDDDRDWYSWLSKQRRAKRTLIRSDRMASRMRIYQVADLQAFVEKVRNGEIVLKKRNSEVAA